MSLHCRIGGLGILGPGLPGWAASAPILAGATPWQGGELALPPPALLPPTERRRTSQPVRLALAAAGEAVAAEPGGTALETIFASSNGDGAILGSILDALLALDGVAISPTQFHNSVHNAPAGYWHIAIGSVAPSLSLGGHDDSFAAGLLAAATAVATRAKPVLLCAYDMPMPPPLDRVRRTETGFAAALVLRPAAGEGAALTLRYRAAPAAWPAPADALDALAAGNPAARSLPLLRALAAGRTATIRLPLLEDAHLELQVAP
ncbi:beta-ketoacyl synthase chain length factor [Siccirubricoccus phaeus]|uniref:beta-ketoacyl synthase chain length factor n=1 Tax=Siccirubricoccus phaeus TaxID=2595053 RepID=UPI0011F3CC46|nr:beta-ketoacyl synthase chain length factor [Siccirubricoccus phaeus]